MPVREEFAASATEARSGSAARESSADLRVVQETGGPPTVVSPNP